MTWFCKHDWKVLDKTVLPSGYEQIVTAHIVPKNVENVPADMFQKKVVMILACSRCGKLVKHVEANPE